MIQSFLRQIQGVVWVSALLMSISAATVQANTGARKACPKSCFCTHQEIAKNWSYLRFYSQLDSWSLYKRLVPNISKPTKGVDREIQFTYQGQLHEVDGICADQEKSRVYAIPDLSQPGQRHELRNYLLSRAPATAGAASNQAAR